MKINTKAIVKIIKSKEKIAIDNKLMKALGLDDARDLFKELGDFGYSTEFTYRGYLTTDVQRFLKAFLRELI